MFSPQQGATMDEMVRQYVRFAVGFGQASAHEPRLRAQHETIDVVGTAAAQHYQQHYPSPTTHREVEPQRRQRVQQVESEESLVGTRASGRGRPVTRKRRTTTVNLNETAAERNNRLAYMRERRRQRIETETDEQKLARLIDTRERARQKLKTETQEEREKRLKYLRDHQRQRIRSETQEEREKRLLYLRERQKERLRNETLEQRQKRLSRSRKQPRKPARSSPPEPMLDVDVQEDSVLYVRDAQCQVILTEPHAEPARDPLDLHDYQASRALQGQDTATTNDDERMRIGRVWSLKPNTPIDDKLWYHNQL